MRVWKFKDSFTMGVILFALGISFALFRQESIAQEVFQDLRDLDQTVIAKLEKGQLLTAEEFQRVMKIQSQGKKNSSDQEMTIASMAKEWLPKEEAPLTQTDRLIEAKQSKGRMLTPSDLQRIEERKQQAKNKKNARKQASQSPTPTNIRQIDSKEMTEESKHHREEQSRELRDDTEIIDDAP